MEPQDPYPGWAAGFGHLRASDADRERVIEALKSAFVQDRLTKGDLARRAGQVLQSKTYADLAGATAGIPAGRAAAPPSRQPAAPVRARAVNWKIVAWVASAIVLSPGLAVAFFATYYGSFFILLSLGFVASGLVSMPRTPGAGRHSAF